VHVSEFDYYLPEQCIAQEPLADRAGSRMLVLYRREGRWEDRVFRDFPEFVRPGDCVVLNDSRVFPARLLGRRVGSVGEVEVFLLRPVSDDAKTWTALVRPGRKMRTGERIRFGELEAEIVARGEFGERTVRFLHEGDIHEALNAVGHVPLPPYIKRADRPEDRERYQTVFAREPGSVAAPTAGLHFTPQILEACRAAGAEIAYVTLHVGQGTFQPLRTDVVEQAKLHTECFAIASGETAKMRAAQRRVCVGTTSVRSLESAWSGRRDETDIFIYPGFAFQATDALLTNFHLPQSSLLMLVCAFAERELVLAAYRHGVEAGYRFYSYGDCMLIV
jgi:S-adenosylmethionine:tRNA ribosyltransferase-isomerase